MEELLVVLLQSSVRLADVVQNRACLDVLRQIVIFHLHQLNLNRNLVLVGVGLEPFESQAADPFIVTVLVVEQSDNVFLRVEEFEIICHCVTDVNFFVRGQ